MKMPNSERTREIIVVPERPTPVTTIVASAGSSGGTKHPTAGVRASNVRRRGFEKVSVDLTIPRIDKKANLLSKRLPAPLIQRHGTRLGDRVECEDRLQKCGHGAQREHIRAV